MASRPRSWNVKTLERYLMIRFLLLCVLALSVPAVASAQMVPPTQPPADGSVQNQIDTIDQQVAMLRFQIAINEGSLIGMAAARVTVQAELQSLQNEIFVRSYLGQTVSDDLRMRYWMKFNEDVTLWEQISALETQQALLNTQVTALLAQRATLTQ